jgi:vacuolar-type H+-ATPase subunit H
MAMKEAVEQVLRAEADGKKGVAQARLKAEGILAEAETKAAEIAERAAGEAIGRGKAIREEARARSEAERDRVLKEIEERVRREEAEKAPLREKAAEKVMEFLLG